MAEIVVDVLNAHEVFDSGLRQYSEKSLNVATMNLLYMQVALSGGSGGKGFTTKFAEVLATCAWVPGLKILKSRFGFWNKKTLLYI
ncbi:hypothetical protein [Prosthecochloris sp. SCSIO W1103]|uniref:hypothetical protein n=1 Tax=Prosthecochloris sp. SCSIO W1103 TaxID=2992244 RepID=UPI00223D9B77|nr:hypothetical protein [Prosthecochloris sp. SCSIO W1103]UZJ37273.1 hypothetical protein OO005_11055 [Prosthecochloris sp. SCSIO W1103]